ncbi:MAG: peptidoglycan-binding domain-containing protein [bacterium]
MNRIVKQILTVAILATMMAGVTQAATVEELNAQIAALMAQLTQLQAQVATATGTPAASCYTFSVNLKSGMSHTDVKEMQKALNSDPATMVASTGVGSSGYETSYFGSLTLAAVNKFQTKYASEVLTPLGLTGATGFVGASTRAKLNSMNCGTTPPVVPPVNPPVTGGFSVALASDSPVTGTLVAGQSMATLAKLNLSNGGTAEVKVTNLKVKRMGVSADATLSNVYLFDGATRLTDAASVSAGVLTFNDSTGLVKVAAGTVKTISVVADIATGSSGQTVGVSVVSATDVTSNASSVNGTFPVTGGTMTIAEASLAGATFAAGATVNPSTATIDPQTDYAVWRTNVVIGTRAVTFTRLSLREIGTINYSDLGNFRLYVGGVQVGTAVAALDTNGYVTFDLASAPKRVETGTWELKVLADIIGGSSRTFSFSLRGAYDANFIDTQYGVTVLPTVTTDSFPRTTGTQTVSSGTVTITKMTDSPSGNLVNSASNVVLAKFQVKTAGERVKIESMRVAVTIGNNTDTNAALRNGAIYANDVQIGSTASLNDTGNTTLAYTTYTFGSSLVVDPTSPVTLTVRADVYNTGTTVLDTTNDTITVTIVGGDLNNAQGLTSSSTIDVPSTSVDGNTLTNSAGGMTLAKYTAYTNPTITVPRTAFKLGHFTLKANTTEAVNVNTIQVDMNYVTGVSGLYVMYGTSTTSVKPTVSATAAANTWSVNYSLAAGQTVDVTVYADLASTAVSGIIPSVLISGTTASSSTAVNTNSNAVLAGQTTTITTGGFVAVLDGSTPQAQIVAGNQTITSAKFKFTSAVDSYTVKELKVGVADAATSAVIVKAVLKDGATTLGEAVFDQSTNTVAYFTGLNILIPAYTNKVLTVDLALSVPSSDAATTQKDVVTTLTWMKYADSTGAETSDDNPATAASITDGVTNADPVGNSIYVYRSVPTFTDLALPTTAVVDGSTATLYKFKAAANVGGQVALKQLKFTVLVTDAGTAGTLTMTGFKFFRGSSDITSLVSIMDSTGDNIEGSTTIVEGSNTVVVKFDTEETLDSTGYEYSLKGVTSGFVASSTGNDSVSTSLLGDAALHTATYTYLNVGTSTTNIFKLFSSGTASGSAQDKNVIWSDVSATAHSYAAGATASADWSNGYLTLNLPLDSKSLTVN